MYNFCKFYSDTKKMNRFFNFLIKEKRKYCESWHLDPIFRIRQSRKNQPEREISYNWRCVTYVRKRKTLFDAFGWHLKVMSANFMHFYFKWLYECQAYLRCWEDKKQQQQKSLICIFILKCTVLYKLSSSRLGSWPQGSHWLLANVIMY